MTVSAVLVVKNDRDVIHDCIASLRQQSEPLHEIIVVDRGSIDGTGALVEAEGAPVRLERRPGLSEEEAYRVGTQRATGDRVLRLPARAWYRPDAVSRSAEPRESLAPVGRTTFGRAAAAVVEAGGAPTGEAGWQFVADRPWPWARAWAGAGRTGGPANAVRAALVGASFVAALNGRGAWRVAIPTAHALGCAAVAWRAGRERGAAPHRAFVAAELRDWSAGLGWWAGP